MPRLDARFIRIRTLGGDHEGAESLALPNTLSTGGSKNLWIDKLGRATSILGYTKTNAAAVVANTGGNPTLLRALCRYAYRNAGVLTRQLVGVFDEAISHYDIRISGDEGATWTFKEDLGAGSVGTIPDFAQIGSQLVFTNGVVAPRKWDGTNWSTISNTRLAAPSVSDGGAGQKNGNYQARVVPILSADGSRKVGSVASATLPLTNKKLTVDWVADSDVAVGSYEIYLTTGTGGVYYYAGTVVGRTTVTFTDNTKDQDLIEARVLEEYGDAPPATAKFAEVHKNRMWYIGDSTNPRRAWWADAGLPFSVYTDASFVDLTDAESWSDISTGASGDFRGMLVLWLERSVWTVSGSGTVSGAITDWKLWRTSAQTGSVSHRAVARIPAGAKFRSEDGELTATDAVTLAYLTPLGDIRLFDGENDRVLSASKSTALSRITYSVRMNAYAVTDVPRGETAWVVPTDGVLEPNLAVVWNWRYGVWYTREWSFGHVIVTDTTMDASVLIGAESRLTVGGFAYLLWDTYGFAGQPFKSVLMTKTFYGSDDNGDPVTVAVHRWRWVEILVHASGELTMLVEWLSSEDADDGAAQGRRLLQITGDQLTTSDGSPLTTIEGSALVVGTPAIIVRVPLHVGDVHGGEGRYLHSRGLRLRMTVETPAATIAPWSIVGLTIMYQQLTGLKRGFLR